MERSGKEKREEEGNGHIRYVNCPNKTEGMKIQERKKKERRGRNRLSFICFFVVAIVVLHLT